MELNDKRIAVLLSGGVDSSVVVYELAQRGLHPDCFYIKIGPEEQEEWDCTSEEDLEMATAVARRFGCKLEVVDCHREYWDQVTRYTMDKVRAGFTPNPDVMCNRLIKFGAFHEKRGHEYDLIATGHYAIIEQDRGTGRYLLKKSADLSKDQSYVLYSLTQDQLSRTLFPLGGLHKTETRRIAEEQGFINAEKRDSQDICFIPDGDYAGFIEKYTGRTYPSGYFTDREGNILGEHRGIIHYTIGQRKGLGLALKKPMYVQELDMERNRVILGDNADLFTREFDAKDFNWIATDTPASDIRAKARIRYKHKEADATIVPTGPDTVHVIFDEPQRAITRGQSVVLYDGDYVIGGGTIC